jgi:hypothetical protein
MKARAGKHLLAVLLAPLVASIAATVVGSVIARFRYDEIYRVQDYFNGLAIAYLVVLAICVAVLLPLHLILLRRVRRPAHLYAIFGFLIGCVLAIVIVPGGPSALARPGDARAFIEVGLVCVLTMVLASSAFWQIVRPPGRPELSRR